MLSLAVALVLQTQTTPVLPPGVRSEFQESFVSAAKMTESANFAGASAALAKMPDFKITYSWDDSKVPAAQRAEFAQTRDEAFEAWKRGVAGLTLTSSNVKPHIKFTFETNLARDPDSGVPQGTTTFTRGGANEPLFEVVIGLKRGEPLQVATRNAIRNSVMYGLGAYLGVADNPFGGAALHRNHMANPAGATPSIVEAGIARRNLDSLVFLRDAVRNKKAVRTGIPQATVDPVRYTREPVVQGTKFDILVQITNNGNGPLNYRVLPDCGCMVVVSGNGLTLGPSETGVVKVNLDTTEFPGELRKRLIVMSNDATEPMRVIPVQVMSQPRYRIVSPEGPVIVVPDGGRELELFLFAPAGAPIEATGVKLVGNDGVASLEPWKGQLADPEFKEAAKPREGYRIRIRASDPPLMGRSAMTVVVSTTDPTFKELRANLFLQKGIVVTPMSLYLGELGASSSSAQIVLSRPGSDFEVTKIESSSEYLTGVSKPITGKTEYRVDVTYNGKAPKGDFSAILSIHTTDPKQPVIKIPIQAVVR